MYLVQKLALVMATTIKVSLSNYSLYSLLFNSALFSAFIQSDSDLRYLVDDGIEFAEVSHAVCNNKPFI